MSSIPQVAVIDCHHFLKPFGQRTKYVCIVFRSFLLSVTILTLVYSFLVLLEDFGSGSSPVGEPLYL
jgi:hypothetical protein